MQIREAVFKDIGSIVELLEEANDEFGCPSVPFCRDTARNTMQRVINQKEHKAFILEAPDKSIQGIIVGLTNQLWYSKKRQVTDLIYYVRMDTRGYGAKLLTTLLAWAREVPNVAEIQLGISSGTKEMDRIEALFRAVGLTKVGSIFNLHPAEEIDQCLAS